MMRIFLQITSFFFRNVMNKKGKYGLLSKTLLSKIKILHKTR